MTIFYFLLAVTAKSPDPCKLIKILIYFILTKDC